jgi:AcrR family transcriptional regulator
VPADDKPRRILDAAVRVFAAQGYDAARVGDIAKKAGVAYGLVYHYVDPDLVRLLVREVTHNPHIQDKLGEIDQAFASLERMVRRGQADRTFAAELDPKLGSWMLYGALEEVLTGWVLGQPPDDAAAVGAAEREVTATRVGGLRA